MEIVSDNTPSRGKSTAKSYAAVMACLNVVAESGCLPSAFLPAKR